MTQSKTSSSQLSAAVACCVLLIITSPALAGTGGDLPWENPLQRLATSFAGPVARSLLILAVVILGFTLAFSEGAVLRRVLGVVLGGTIAATAGSFALSFLGFANGATF